MTKKAKRTGSSLEVHYESVLGDISNVIDAAKRSAARSANCIMTAAYWLIGRRIVESEQKGEKRAAYGEELLKRLSVDLGQRFGRGFGVDNLQRFRTFYLVYSFERIYATRSRKLHGEDQIVKYATPLRISQEQSIDKPEDSILQALSDILRTPSAELPLIDIASCFPLPWSAYVRLLGIKNEHARAFYETEALRGGWSVRQLDRQVNSQFYERTALSRNKAAMLSKGGKALPEDRVDPAEEIKDPFVLEFLDLKDEAVARYALEGLPNKVMASEYRTALPGEKELAAEIGRTQALLQDRKRLAPTSLIAVRAKKSAKKEVP
jgi:hypothetical protein